MCCRWEAAIALVMHPALWEIKGFLQSDYVQEIALLSYDTKQCLLLPNSPICCVFCAMQHDSFTSIGTYLMDKLKLSYIVIDSE